MKPPMMRPSFSPGDRFTTRAGWIGEVVKKHPRNTHRGYRVQWICCKAHRFTTPGDECDLQAHEMGATE